MDDFGGIFLLVVFFGIVVLILYAIAAVIGIALFVAAVYGLVRTIINYIAAFREVMAVRKNL